MKEFTYFINYNFLALCGLSFALIVHVVFIIHFSLFLLIISILAHQKTEPKIFKLKMLKNVLLCVKKP